ncbi:MAG: hypothetical protein M1827_006451 [Pycnora praestabilis]|nr:MAG: hypothetical protein M1827_006451 [Pycnora praestabilis]
MDILQDYISQALHLYNTTSPYLRPLRKYGWLLASYINPYTPYLNSLNALLSSISTQKADLTSLVLVLIVLFLSLKLFGILWRGVIGWIVLAFRFAFYIAVCIIGVWIWQRGIDGFVGDIMGWGSEVSEVFEGEKRRWEELQRQQGMRGGAYGAGDNSAWGRGGVGSVRRGMPRGRGGGGGGWF